MKEKFYLYIGIFLLLGISTTFAFLKKQQQPSSHVQQIFDNPKCKYAWNKDFSSSNCLINRIATPNHYFRDSTLNNNSFAYWLQHIPLLEGKPLVKLHNDLPKLNQFAHEAIIDIDRGNKDLQQCADAVIRLRAEYLYSHKRYDDIKFKFTSGDLCSFSKWAEGYRPIIKGNKVSWAINGKKGYDYTNFKSYLQTIFMYCGTASLSKELKSKTIENIAIGDVFIQGGFPGHAVIVVDLAKNNKNGEKQFLLAQSYMPAQDIHILKNPKSNTPWYKIPEGTELVTPEWTFNKTDLKSF